MFNFINTWYKRYFTDPQASLLVILLAFGLIISVTMGKMLAPLLAALIIAYLLEGAVSKLQIRDISRFSSVNIVGLDKITAKTKSINIKIGETVKFGLLEIKALKCGILNKSKRGDSVAYIQVRDISENQNEKVFIFNGWTFSSNPSLTPFDHAIYDIWLDSCKSA